MTPPITISLFAIDDEKMLRDVMDFEFEQAGFQPYELFRDPLVFKERFSKEVGVAVLDVTLRSEITGIDLARYIRQMNGYNTEIIFLTGTEDVAVAFELANVGRIYKLVRKDGDMTTLMNYIRAARISAQENYDKQKVYDAYARR